MMYGAQDAQAGARHVERMNLAVGDYLRTVGKSFLSRPQPEIVGERERLLVGGRQQRSPKVVHVSVALLGP
jgi:hypothetical protein